MGRGAVKMHFAYLWIYVRGELNKHVKVLKVTELCHENTKERKESELEYVLGLENNYSQLSRNCTKIQIKGKKTKGLPVKRTKRDEQHKPKDTNKDNCTE
ncbi:hypothetical protein RR48_00416 [Papilio machaon]|uniref:Uncharacterized protein n=1 Tax=Papilio machaon TaxID=76193 RepID=A0A0N1IHR5_PAPMA|nr:hypothetical protein RR48_00416 [Papilio machaon]